MERPTAAELLGFGGSTVRAVRALRGSRDARSGSPRAGEMGCLVGRTQISL